MADNLLNLGQSSETKYSLKPFLNKQEIPIPIAHDIAQAIQVSDNAFKAYKSADDEANQARYFNAVTEFNDTRTQQQDEMLAAGNDLNAQRLVLDKYRPQLEGLSTKYELNKKYTADLGSKVEGHNSGWEEYYRGKYNAQQEGIADTNIAEVIKSMQTIGVGANDINNTLLGLKEYRKNMTGSMDDRITSVKIADMFGNTRITSMDKDTLTFKQASDIKSETLSIMEKFDPKITTTAEYRKVKDAFDFVEEKKRVDEANVFEKTIKESHMPPKEAAKAIATKVAEGVVKKEHAELMLLTATNNYTDREAVLRNQAYTESNRKESEAEKELKYTYYQHALNDTPLEDMQKVMYDKGAKLGLDRRIVDHYIDTYRKPLESAIAKKQVGQLKEKIGNLLENKVIVHNGKEVTPEEFKEDIKLTSDGVYGQEQQNKFNAYNIQYIATKSPEAFAATPKAAWGVHSDDASKNVSMVAQHHLITGDIGKVAKLAESYGGEALKLNEFFNIGIMSKDPDTYNKTLTAYVALKKALPLSYDDVIGKELSKKIGMMSDIMMKSKDTMPTPNTWDAVENSLKNDINYEDKKYRTPQESLNTFMTKMGITNRKEVMDKFNNRIRLGGEPSVIGKEIQEAYTKLDTGNPNVDIYSYGKEVDSFTKDTLNKGTEYLTKISAGAVTGYVYNPATKSMWLSTPTNKYAYRTMENIEDFTKEIHSNMLVAKEKFMTKEARDAYSSMEVNNPEALPLPDSGSGKAIKDIMLKTPTQADKRRLKQIVTGTVND